MATINFCTNETEISLADKSITLSRLFLWYKTDFVFNHEQYPTINDELLIKYNLFMYFLPCKIRQIKTSFSYKFKRFISENIRKGDEKLTQLQILLENNKINDIKLLFASYDWNINIKV